MTIAFVIGNGVSRQGISLEHLKTLGTVYGCNALYRDFVPDVLIATDKPIAQHIQESGYPAQHKFYTRRPLPGLGAHTVPKDYFGFSSGPIAVSLAAIDGYSRVYMLGFDMGPGANQKINNVYAGTEFYRPVDSPPTFAGNWVKQLIRILSDFPQTQFIRVQGKTTANIKEFDSVKNLYHLPMHTFVDRINNTKDL